METENSKALRELSFALDKLKIGDVLLEFETIEAMNDFCFEIKMNFPNGFVSYESFGNILDEPLAKQWSVTSLGMYGRTWHCMRKGVKPIKKILKKLKKK